MNGITNFDMREEALRCARDSKGCDRPGADALIETARTFEAYLASAGSSGDLALEMAAGARVAGKDLPADVVANARKIEAYLDGAKSEDPSLAADSVLDVPKSRENGDQRVGEQQPSGLV
jgi:hypothetical protein